MNSENAFEGVAVREYQAKEYVDQMLKLWALSQTKPKDFLVELNENANSIAALEQGRESELNKTLVDMSSLEKVEKEIADEFESDPHKSYFINRSDPTCDYISHIDYLVDRITDINSCILSWRDVQSAQLKYRYMNLEKSLVDIADDLQVSYPSIKRIVMKAQEICVDSMRTYKTTSISH